MDTAKRLLEFASSPVGIMAILIAVGIFLLIRRRHSQTSRKLLVTACLLCLLYVFSPIAEILICGLEKDNPPLLAPNLESRPQLIVVLSAYGEEHPGVPVTSTISSETCCRLAEGLRLYRLLPDAKLLLSGGVLREGDKPVAGIMADFCQQTGMPPEKLIVEGGSQTTYENLVEVKKIVGIKPFVLVTSGFAMRRALAVAGRLEMNPVPAPACLWAIQHLRPEMPWREWALAAASRLAHPSLARLTYIQHAWHEHLGYLWYSLLGRI